MTVLDMTDKPRRADGQRTLCPKRKPVMGNYLTQTVRDAPRCGYVYVSSHGRRNLAADIDIARSRRIPYSLSRRAAWFPFRLSFRAECSSTIRAAGFVGHIRDRHPP